MEKSIKAFIAAVVAFASIQALPDTPDDSDLKPVELKNGAVFNRGDPPKALEARLADGETVCFTLSENATTGYQWFASCDTNECTVAVEHRGPAKPKAGEPVPCGAPGSAAVSITRKPSAPSPVTAKLEYKRGWEKNVEPIHVIEVRMSAKEP